MAQQVQLWRDAIAASAFDFIRVTVGRKKYPLRKDQEAELENWARGERSEDGWLLIDKKGVPSHFVSTNGKKDKLAIDTAAVEAAIAAAVASGDEGCGHGAQLGSSAAAAASMSDSSPADAPAGSLLQASSSSSSAWFWAADDESWTPYSEECNAALDRAVANGRPSAVLTLGTLRYVVDFGAMSQRNEATGYTRTPPALLAVVDPSAAAKRIGRSTPPPSSSSSSSANGASKRPRTDAESDSRGPADKVKTAVKVVATAAAFAGGKQYDVFLSHRQVDAQDFCALVYEQLVALGFRVFLDRRDAGALHDLPAIVASSRCLVFVMSSGVFASNWCLLELDAALRHGVSVLPLRMEGATWDGRNFPDLDGPYMPMSLRRPDGSEVLVRPLLEELFKHKAVEHSREYHHAFFDKLVARLREHGMQGGLAPFHAPQPPMHAGPAAGHGAGQAAKQAATQRGVQAAGQAAEAGDEGGDEE